MVRALEKIDDLLSVRIILVAFWTSFWLLNGLDKFFNYDTFFGVTSDEKFIDYFARLDLPSGLAVPTLYAFGVLELTLALGFLYVLIGIGAYSIMNRISILYILMGRGAYSIVNRLNFKGSLLMFFAFSIGDILFGDRQELWEHGTFLVLVIVSYQFFLAVDRPVAQAAVGDRSRADAEAR